LEQSNKFISAGLTAGVDVRLNRNLIVGAALGYGADHTDVGDHGTRSSSDSFSGALYASMHLLDPLFIDAAIGGGSLGYDNNRWLRSFNEIVSGDRDGGYWFGTIEASFEMRFDAFKLAPYLRADYMGASLNSYSENGSTQLLNYDAMHFSALSGSVGLRGSYDIQTPYGIVTPYGRLEYRATSQSAYDETMYYLDLGPDLTSTLSQPAGSYGATTGALGLRVRTIGGLSAEVEYGVTGGSNDLMAQTIRGRLRLPF
jgi:outer membrane autotransporter protein